MIRSRRAMKNLGVVLVLFALILAAGLALSVTGPAGAQPPTVKIQLAVVLDGSGSINSTEWNTEIDGLKAVLNDSSCIPRDGSVELTVIQFGGQPYRISEEWYYNPGAITHISPTVITSDNWNDVVNQVEAIRTNKIGGASPLHYGINEAVAQITGSSNFATSLWQIINIATDGGANSWNQMLQGPAQTARNNARSVGIDEISSEGVGDISNPSVQWLRNNLAYPDPGYEAPPFERPGWTSLVGVDSNLFKEAICHKVGLATYTLTVDVDGCCTIKVDGVTVTTPYTGVYTYSEQLNWYPDVTIEADDSGVCCSFDSWTVDGEPVVGDPNPKQVTVTMNDDHSVVAVCDTLEGEVCFTGEWEDDPANPCQERREILTCSSGQCTGSGDYEYRNANEGEVCFTGEWEADPANTCQERREILTCSSGQCTFSEYEYRAKGPYTLTTGSTAGGSVSEPGEPGPYPYECGEVVDLVAAADSGYRFVNWTGDVDTIDNVGADNTTIIMNGDYTITANFVRSGGGGGGGFAGPACPEELTVDFLGEITEVPMTRSGVLCADCDAPSPDEMHLLEIEEGTTVLDSEGEVVKLIEITEVTAPSLPASTALVGSAYDFGGNLNVTFSKPVTLTLSYNVSDLRDDTLALSMRRYSIEDGLWQVVETESSQIADIGSFTGKPDSFSVFAILADVPSFELSNLSITLSRTEIWGFLTFAVRTGEEAVITVDVENTGNYEASCTVSLVVNGETRATQPITLAPGVSEQVEFTISGNEPGLYEIVVGDLSEPFTSSLWINWLPIGAILGALLLIVFLLVGWQYRKREKPAE